MLNEASKKDIGAAQRLQEEAQRMQEVAIKHLLSAAEAGAETGTLKMTQLAYTEAADYYRQAAHLVPQGHETSCATDLNMGGIKACSWKCGAKSAFIVPNNLFLTITFD